MCYGLAQPGLPPDPDHTHDNQCGLAYPQPLLYSPTGTIAYQANFQVPLPGLLLTLAITCAGGCLGPAWQFLQALVDAVA